jgi:drug/metabolite transporter (DMT)-like permease
VPSQRGIDEATRARLLLVLLAFVWGLSWPITKIALEEVGVFTLRALGFSISAASLFAVIFLQGRSPSIPRGAPWLHLFVASVFNVIGFGLFSSYAQLAATTSRVVIINYSMPVWGSLMAWLILHERPTTIGSIGLVLCMAGLATLIVPVATTQSGAGMLLALGCALCWGAGAIYMKWARIPGDLLAVTAWQTAIGGVFFGAGLFIFQGAPEPSPVSVRAMLAIAYNGLIGTGLAYILWFAIIERLPTTTASLGTLLNPVVGVIGSILILGERLTITDVAGFALIFAAAACVLIEPGGRKRTPEGIPS